MGELPPPGGNLTLGNLSKRPLPEAVRRAIKIAETAPDERRMNDSRAFHVLVVPVEVEGKLYAAKITLRETLRQDPEGMPHKFYDIAPFKTEDGLQLRSLKDSEGNPLLLKAHQPSSTVTVADLARAVYVQITSGRQDFALCYVLPQRDKLCPGIGDNLHRGCRCGHATRPVLNARDSGRMPLPIRAPRCLLSLVLCRAHLLSPYMPANASSGNPSRAARQLARSSAPLNVPAACALPTIVARMSASPSCASICPGNWGPASLSRGST